MSSFSLDTLAQYANPPNNILGTSLFLSYNVATLYLTSAICINLYRKYIAVFSTADTAKETKFVRAAKDARSRHVKVYAFLASISFATLSYHMLNFLIASYVKWSGSPKTSMADISSESLKRWMLESTLFEDFATELVRDGPSAVWTQMAIIGTWFWNVWIAGKAEQRKLSTGSITSYIILSQILPISFTVSLFIIHLHLSSPDISPPSTQPTSPPTKRYVKTSLALPTILINAGLLILPSLRNHQLFIPLVLFTRVLLLLPYSGRISTREDEIVKSAMISVGFVVAHVVTMRKAYGVRDVMRGVWSGGEALKAVGWDADLGVLVFCALGWGGL
ncbi:hypothetical protein BDV95DRAFT_546611 [Massariosphaeria phaeospora]|uniref:Uncharacterized protein n=1 Tax=Massariosphaeria phaeospora TaxID=100035 RepID=A0A7C8MAF1_9PLEO|nr:hypothetical protein BDV95DRAFT_546611 [Massariosphaeria phaeospora]